MWTALAYWQSNSPWSVGLRVVVIQLCSSDVTCTGDNVVVCTGA